MSLNQQKTKLTLLAGFIFISLQAQVIELPAFATGFTAPTEIANAGDSRLFVAEQAGAIKIVTPDGVVNPENFLTIDPSMILASGDRGLLGLAFHPQYATNGYFYVFYTRADGASILARYSVDPLNANKAVANSHTVLMEIEQPSTLHKGGALHFGSDSYLYIIVGDGGAALAAQGPLNPYGKMLRINPLPAGEALYTIPESNPYFSSGLGMPEVWSLGLRNAWKFSFDRQTNDTWIADVGLDTYEEINHTAVGISNSNYGWPCYEGVGILTPGCAVPETVYTAPVAQFAHADGNCSIIGGYVYRGINYPNLQGKYIFTDFCMGKIGMFDVANANLTFSQAFPNNYFTTFGEDVNGELYIASGATGTVHKIVDALMAVTDFNKPAFSMVPNPADKQFSIATLHGNYPIEVRISDMTGKTLSKKQVQSQQDFIATEMLQSGLYIVNVTDQSGVVSSSKLTVSR
jgi:glucose/arabinose dehydrogenase